LQCQAATDLDDVVRDHPKANPSLHAFKASVPAAIQSMATLQHAILRSKIVSLGEPNSPSSSISYRRPVFPPFSRCYSPN
jgi:hypothetical protein